uniref:B-block binding subunit of TFIIIC domain-containing protein n=1 Tax=Amphiprion ocellaris TaxID=80972 RepID=A0A3Q1AI97_AMPOC
MDPWSIVPDEVALEGLDGITIPTLWIRLENREPKFPLKLDDCTKELIWKYLASNTDLKFYELPKEREDVVLFDRDEITHKTLETHQDIYPIHVVPENKDRMQGSCAHFKERKDVTKHIRSKSLTLLINLEEALERFGRKLVVVASQTLRFRTLIGSESDPDLKLTDDSYCVLERVGRARWQGELQRDLHGGSFKVDARKFHYLRKSLVRHQLVTMQAYIRRLESGQQQHSILLLLKRFHINRRTKYDVLMEYVSNCLQQSPGQFATMMMFKAQLVSIFLCECLTFRRLFKYMRAAKLIEFCQYPLEELDPSAGPCTNKNGSKVLVRCVRLIKPYAKKGIPDDEDDDDDEDEEDDAGGRTGGFPSEGRIMERDIMSQGSVCEKSKKSLRNSHETYRLLRRKNLIVEAVRNFKIIEGLFPLQKIINDEEKQSGVSSKCCKKTIVRLIHGLSREGLLKLFTTTVVQDGITKKVDLVVHPSIEPSDEIVKQVIEQVRFKISSSYTAVRLQHAEESARDQKTKDDRKKGGNKDDSEFKPTIVRGLSKTFGFQPKMPRLRVVHTFLWYLIYGHPLQQSSACTDSTSQTQTSQNNSDPDAKDTDSFAKQHLKEMENSTSDMYVDDDSWKRFVPPVRLHKDYTRGWAMVGDLLLCLPLSIFVQVIQVNYQVDGLEDYLNDPVMQHHLVRTLPYLWVPFFLFFFRKYIFFFNESLQKLVYMGLLQYGPTTKFKEKDQVFVYLRRNTTIIDTTNADPHYWLITESPDKPFERRKYTLDTAEDVENYWFDLMCVCLNTPLGTCTHNHRSTLTAQPVVKFSFDLKEKVEGVILNLFIQMNMSLYTYRGNHEACDDGSIPGDGKGAGGLDSEFFAHLKRNWLWTNHLLAVKSVSTSEELNTHTVLSINCFPFLCLCHQVAIEPSSRNQQVVGGKGQKRRRSKKDPKKRTPAHDEADHKALKMMTKQRVYWSIQEDSLMMLCSVASHLFNSKLKRPFVPHCVVRDMLHAEFEISMDKTSLAVGRRSRYILKNPQTLLNYRICLAEVFQDETLMRLLEENKPTVPDSPEDCAKAFSEYIRLLRQKFSCVLSAGDLIMPDTKQQLFSRFKVSAIDDRRKVTEDIHAIVLHNLIQSTLAMTNSQMKSSRSFQAFHMYSKYNQELLCRVFIECRKRGLVNRRRVNQPFGPKKNRALPILPMSYQLSQSYYRCFSWRFPQSLCTDSFCFLRNLINNGRGDDSAATRASEGPPDVSDMLQFSLFSPGGACVVSLSLMSLGLLSVHLSIPKQMVVVDSSLVDNDVVKSMATLEEEDDDDDDGEDCEGRKKLQVTAHQASHTNYLIMRGYCSPGIVKIRNLNTSDNIVVESCIMRLLLRNTPAHHVFNSPPLDLTKCGPSLLPSILTYFVHSPSTSRPSVEECNSRFIQQRGYTPQDIEACDQLRRSLHGAGKNGLDVHDLHKAHMDLQEPQSGRTRSLQQYMQDFQEEGQAVTVGSLGVRWVLMQHAEPWLLTVNPKQWSQLHNTSDGLPSLENPYRRSFVHKRCNREIRQDTEEPPAKRLAVDGDKGSDVEEVDVLPNNITKEKINAEQQQKETEDEESGGKQVNLEEEGRRQTQADDEGKEKGETEKRRDNTEDLRVGEHSLDGEKDDKKCSPDQGSPHDDMSFIGRPWRMVDGTLNRPVCKGMLEAILYHIMSRPGLTQQRLMEHYKDLLQPRAVLDLVKALIDMGCVTKKTLVKSPKPSLFSCSAHQTRSETKMKIEEPDTIYYEPTICCCLRLCQVLPNERHWNQCTP